MKKYLITSMLVLSMLTLVSCGKSEVVDSPTPGAVSIESVVENTQESIIEVPEKVEETTDVETTDKELEEVPDDALKIDEENQLENTEETTESKTESAYQLVLDKDSELVASSNFDGLYRSVGYSRMQLSSKLSSFQIVVESLSDENKGTIDASKAGLPGNIIDFMDEVYFDLSFENGEISRWDVIDRETFQSILAMSEEELTSYYLPEVNYELVDAGKLPEKINLSDYEIGKTYVFEAPSEDNFEPPVITNNTNHPLLIVSIKNDKDGDFKREYKPKYAVPDMSLSSTYSNDGKYYVAITEDGTSGLMNSDECLKLSGYQVGDKLDFEFEDFIGNNTNSIITLSVSIYSVENEYTLLPGEILECSWMNTVFVKNIG